MSSFPKNDRTTELINGEKQYIKKNIEYRGQISDISLNDFAQHTYGLSCLYKYIELIESRMGYMSKRLRLLKGDREESNKRKT